MNKNIKQAYFNSLNLLSDFINIEENLQLTEQISSLMAEIFGKGNKILICGNGGSLCDAMHFAEEFTGRFRNNRKPLPVIALTDSSHITCTANDYGFDEIFSRGVEAYGKKNDLLVVLSTSGNSVNILKAVQKAKELDLISLALLGKDGGKLKNICDFEFIIPGNTSDRIQEIHMIILHIIIENVERVLFPDNYKD